MNPKTQSQVDIFSQPVFLRSSSEERLDESVLCTAIALINWAPQAEGVRDGNLARLQTILKKNLPINLSKCEDWKMRCME